VMEVMLGTAVRSNSWCDFYWSQLSL